MTRNQISYLEHMESKRHNLATEKEAKRSNLAKESIEYTKNVETERSHRANEAFNLDSLGETKRSNQQKELLTLLDLDEKHRSNVAQEELKAAANYIQQLYNEGRLDIEEDKLEETKRQFDVGQGLKYGSSLLSIGAGYLLGKGSNVAKGAGSLIGGAKTASTILGSGLGSRSAAALSTLGALGTVAAMTGGAIYLGSNYSSKNPKIFEGGKNKDG